MAKPRHDPNQHLKRDIAKIREAALYLSIMGGDHWGELLVATADGAEATNNAPDATLDEVMRWSPAVARAVGVADIVLTKSPLYWVKAP
jgi:hypothetical protein